jgi:SNF2 family DNA or RNA helicase
VTTVEERAFTRARSLPNGELFFSPWGLLEFQADGLAHTYLSIEPGTPGGVIAVWDTGLGKTLLGIALAAYLYVDDKIDLVMVVAEKNKITDWRDDFERFSALATHRYHGAGRQKRLAKADPHVVITTYETGRTDLMRRETNGARGKGTKVDGPLVEALGLHDKRVLWIFDEVTRLRGRGSELHQAYAYLLRELRKGPHHQRVLGLTATPMERDVEDAYNVGRIVCPTLMPTVAAFERTFTRGVDQYNRYLFRKDTEGLFAQMFQRTILRKRKTDADVIAQFPQQVEESVKVEMNGPHRSLYNAITELCGPGGDEDDRSALERATAERRLYTALRMTTGHPAAHLHSTSVISSAVQQAVGAGLRDIHSSKSEELIARLKPIVKGQGAQAVVFTFFANTVLVELAADLRRAGFSVAEYHGRQTLKQNDDAKDRFKAGESEILLTSDAGSRGMNLQNAEYVFEYESALTFANRTQRINRIHRIDSEKPLVTCFTMIVEDSIEEGLVNLMLARNERQDILLGDEDDGSGFIDAATRRELLRVARKKR